MTNTPYTVPLHNRLLRRTLRPVFRGLYHLLSRVRISGWENIPARGPYLIVFNHVSIFDGPLVLAFWPVIPEAAGAVDIWDRPVQNVLVRLYGGIPVHRGEFDRQLIDTLHRVLRSGRPLLYSPEGGRSHSLGMRRALPGAAYLAEDSLPIVPAAIIGATDDFFALGLKGKRPVIEMRIGRPFTLPPLEGKGRERRLARQRNADTIMLHLAKLLPAEYHGVYAHGLPGDAPPEAPLAEESQNANGK